MLTAHQEGFVELEGTWDLCERLMHTVEELQEDWAALVGVSRAHTMPTPVSKLVAKVQPLFLHKHAKPLQSKRGVGLVLRRHTYKTLSVSA